MHALTETMTDMPICIAAVTNMYANEYLFLHDLRVHSAEAHASSQYHVTVRDYIMNLLTDPYNVTMHDKVILDMINMLRHSRRIDNYLNTTHMATG